MAGPAPNQFRWKDIAGSVYRTSFQDGFNYGQPAVTITYECIASTLTGTLEATGLKPNFAYQMKLVANPDALYWYELSPEEQDFVTAVGDLGRWWDMTTSQINPPFDPNHQMQAYLLFDHFETDNAGSAVKDFYADSSFHVLFTGSGWYYPTLNYVNPSGPPPNDEAYDNPYPSATWVMVGAQAEPDRPAPGSAFLPPGDYELAFLLTEESFHESGLGGWWASAMAGLVRFHIWSEDSGCLCGDIDGSGLIDLNDFSTFALCFSGGYGARPPECPQNAFACCDQDADGDVDLSDFSTFALRYGAPPACCDF